MLLLTLLSVNLISNQVRDDVAEDASRRIVAEYHGAASVLAFILRELEAELLIILGLLISRRKDDDVRAW